MAAQIEEDAEIKETMQKKLDQNGDVLSALEVEVADQKALVTKIGKSLRTVCVFSFLWRSISHKSVSQTREPKYTNNRSWAGADEVRERAIVQAVSRK